MVVKCIVRDCRSEWYPASDVIFHKFPSDPTNRNIWLSIVPLRRPYFENARICSLHFKDTDYDSSGRRLLFGVTPFYEECNVHLMLDEAQTVTKIKQSTSLNYEMGMGNMPSTSHHVPLPLRDTTNEIENIPPSKKLRLLEILDTHQQDEKKSKQAQTVTKTKQSTSLNYEMGMGSMPSTSHHVPLPLRDTTNEIENIPPSKKLRLLEILDTHQQDEKKSKQAQTVTKTKQSTSLNYEMGMGNMPSTSHHVPLPLRDTTNEIENIPPSKKLRLLEILDTHQQDEKKSKQVNNRSTSPVQFGVDKSVQAKIKTSREKGLEKRNKFWAEKARRLNKSVKTLKSLMNIVMNTVKLII